MNKNEKEIKKVVGKFYSLISGKRGECRDWNSFRELFYPNARLIPHNFSNKGTFTTILYDVETYIKSLESYLNKNNFFEEGIIHKIDIHRNTAQVDSSYIAKSDSKDIKPLKKGKNYIQLLFDGAAWKLVSMLWENE
ncbi:hypothetical protein ACFLTH_00680 [Bacteroidota bacterium]